MSNNEAKFVLAAYRPNGRDAGDPAMADALQQAGAIRRLARGSVANRRPTPRSGRDCGRSRCLPDCGKRSWRERGRVGERGSPAAPGGFGPLGWPWLRGWPFC